MNPVPGYQVREATAADLDAIVALMPRLAGFDVPEVRNPLHLWQEDAELARRWAAGEADCEVVVAEGSDGTIVGFALARLRPELLSGEPSAHLEAIALAPEAEGSGAARSLLNDIETRVRNRGAESMSLHVFAVNARARRFYEREGYDGELMRYIRRFGNEGESE